MADERKVLINIHSSENRAPSGSVLNYGEIAVSHHSKQDAALYTKISDDVVSKFISEDAIDGKISAYTDELVDIIQNLVDIAITDIQAVAPISASTKVLVTESCGNTVTIMHVTGSEQSGFKKLSSDAYGHITAGIPVEIGDVSGLTGFQKAVRDVETKLTSGTTGSGNAVTDIQVNDHEITFVKGENFALSGHTHDVSEIVSGVVDTVSDFSGLTTSGSLVDAKVVKDVIVQNERITSAALNNLNDRINELSGTTPSIETTLAVYDDSAITVTVGEETSNALVVPYAISAATIINTVKTESEFSALTENGSYVDAKLIRDIIYDNEEVTSAALNDLNDMVEELSGNSRTVIDTIEAFSGVSSIGSLVDAKIVKDVIVQNERITSAALNDLNDRVQDLEESISGLSFSEYASAITINGTSHVVVNNSVDLGNYLSASTAHITTIQQTSTTSAVTTTINYITENGSASAATIVQYLVIDCGTY